MHKKRYWLDTVSYLLMTLFIILFILVFVRDKSDLMAVLMLILLTACVMLLLYSLKQKRQADLYRELLRWAKAGDLDDKEILSPELAREMEPFFRALDKKYSYLNLKTDMEYTALQNQINPHFLYNTLDAIRSQAIAIGADDIADMTGKLSRFFRYSIRNRGDLVTLEEELHNVEDYFSIQRYRFEDRFRLEIQVEDPAAYQYYLPKMTFQPIIENSLYHGLEPRKGKGRLTIRVELLERSMRIRISDDGCGMDEESLEKIRRRLAGKFPEKNAVGKRTGVALYNVNKRLQILFGESCGLEFSSVPGMGTDVEIRVPLVDEEKRSRYLG